jgi:hypothetical protein
VKAGERNKVHRKLAKIGVQLARESKAASDARHDSRDKVVKITESGSRKFEGAEADVIQGLVIENHTFIGILHELMNRESGVVRLHNSVGNLGRRNN